MSKRMLSSRESVRPFAARSRMMEGLEDRTMMSVGPMSIPNASSNDTVFDANTKTLHAIYYDTASTTLKYQAFNDDGTASTAETVDAGVNTGLFLSIAEDSAGNLHAAYYDANNGDLKYAHRDLAGVWTTSTIDSRNTVGYYPSITFAADGKPVVSYYYKNGGDLRIAKFDGSVWNISTIASTGDVGRYSKLMINPTTNKLAVGFESTSTGRFMYAEDVYSSSNLTPAPASGFSWSLSTADGLTKGGGGYISLNFNAAGQPALSYYDAFNADLKYSERSSRGKWTATTVASHNSQGLYTNLAFTYNTNQPAIVYYNKTADSVMLAYRQTSGAWTFETNATGGGRNVTPADGVTNGAQTPDLYLVYTDSATGGLKVNTI
ncbi:MAG: exported protein of unknown function [Phycisphaerales bacterium]|nr:exported protein of unknown function [Phycisphaerales bacterium]